MTAHVYTDLQDAAAGVLCEAVRIASDAGKRFAVIGGWSPFLLNSGAIKHPGTRDVDLLFERGSSAGELRDVLAEFLKCGYLSSAKHQFQLLRIVSVHDREFVFNIDFLHPTEMQEPPEWFVDHLSLDDSPLMYRYQSIVVPMSTLLFEEDGQTPFKLKHIAPTGTLTSVEIPLMSELGTLLTKCKSMTQAKRTRDAFDVLLAILQARHSEDLSDAIRQNCIEDRLEGLWGLVDHPGLRKNIGHYWSDARLDETWAVVAKKVTDFLDDAGIERPDTD